MIPACNRSSPPSYYRLMEQVRRNYPYKVDLAITLASLSFSLGRSIRFDPVKEKIVGDREAARLARPVYRRPWKFPAEYL